MELTEKNLKIVQKDKIKLITKKLKLFPKKKKIELQKVTENLERKTVKT